MMEKASPGLTRESLTLGPPMWVGIAILALLAVGMRLRQDPHPKTLHFVDASHPRVLRVSAGRHDFESLGIRWTAPQGWTYLSEYDDAVTFAPVMVNSEQQIIVRLQRWNPDLTTVTKRFPFVKIGEVTWFLPIEETTLDQPESTSDPSATFLGQERDSNPIGLVSPSPLDRLSLLRQAKRLGCWQGGKERLLVTVMDLRFRTTIPQPVHALLASLESDR